MAEALGRAGETPEALEELERLVLACEVHSADHPVVEESQAFLREALDFESIRSRLLLARETWDEALLRETLARAEAFEPVRIRGSISDWDMQKAHALHGLLAARSALGSTFAFRWLSACRCVPASDDLALHEVSRGDADPSRIVGDPGLVDTPIYWKPPDELGAGPVSDSSES